MLFAEMPDVKLDANNFIFPAKPCTRPPLDVFPLPTALEHEESLAHVKIHATTCNVLTLRGKPSLDVELYGIEGPARQEDL